MRGREWPRFIITPEEHIAPNVPVVTTSTLWAAFAVLFSAGALTAFADPRERPGQFLTRDARLMVLLSVGVLFGMMAKQVAEARLGPARWRGGAVDRLRPVAEAVMRASQPGDIVYNVDWADFPELFFWNAKNRYVSGLDPIFLFGLGCSIGGYLGE